MADDELAAILARGDHDSAGSDGGPADDLPSTRVRDEDAPGSF
jgi:hypothetical protein